jgi:hypothetical protein
MKDWTPSERERQAAVLAGRSVVANMRRGADEALMAWAEEQGLLVYIGRRTRNGRWSRSPWQNPFQEGKPGSRDEIIAAYRRHLEASPGLKAQLSDLRGKVLACWCHPLPGHGDILCEALTVE